MGSGVGSPPRVVSLVPSATESLAAWGVDPVACTRFCERPDLPAVGGTKDPDVGAIVALRPDLVVLCREENRRADAEDLDRAGIATHVLAIDAVDEVAPALVGLAGAVGLDPDRLDARALLGRVQPAGAPPGDALRAFVPIWRRPWMSIGARCYGTSLLDRIGVEAIVPPSPDRYPTTDLDEMSGLDVQVVLAPSEPYPFAQRHVTELAQVAPVVLVDGQDLFWWGVRTPAAAARLRAAIVRATREVR